MKLINLLIMLSMLCIFSSCDKDDEEGESSPIVGTWQVVNYERKTGVNGPWSVVSDLSCRMQERQTYGQSGQFSQVSGACSGSTAGISGTWKLSADQKSITYTYTNYSGEYVRTVEKLNDSELVISWDSGTTTGAYFRASYRKAN